MFLADHKGRCLHGRQYWQEQTGIHGSSHHSHHYPFVSLFIEYNCFSSCGGEGTYSQTAVLTNLQVVASQHLLFPQPSTPPQSQSSPDSTIPLPHSFSVIILTSLLEVKHVVLTLRLLNAEQIFPTEQGLKVSI